MKCIDFAAVLLNVPKNKLPMQFKLHLGMICHNIY